MLVEFIGDFHVTRSVSDEPKLGRPRTATDDESGMVVLAKIAVRPQRSVRKFASEMIHRRVYAELCNVTNFTLQDTFCTIIIWR